MILVTEAETEAETVLDHKVQVQKPNPRPKQTLLRRLNRVLLLNLILKQAITNSHQTPVQAQTLVKHQALVAVVMAETK